MAKLHRQKLLPMHAFTFTRSSGATAVFAIALDPPAHASWTENSFKLSNAVAVHGSFLAKVPVGWQSGKLLPALLCISDCSALPSVLEFASTYHHR